jgi:hypothetical protein
MYRKTLLAAVAVAAMTAVTAHAQGMDPNAPTPGAYPSSPDGAPLVVTGPPRDHSVVMPVSPTTGEPDPNVADTPPTLSPSVETARWQPPLDGGDAQSPRQPPASNESVTIDVPGPIAH